MKAVLIFILTVSHVTAGTTLGLWPEGHPALGGLEQRNTPTLTLFKPAGESGTTPVILIVCPGGGYGGQTMGQEGHNVAAWYARHGIIGVTLKYRLPKKGKWSPEKPYSTLRDAQRAVQVMRFMATELGVPNAKVGIMGFSAGGHLACMSATRWRDANAAASDPVDTFSSRPDFACLIYPVISFMPHGHGGSKNNLLGPAVSDDLARKYSGEHNVTKNTPPIFMAHADDDGVSVKNSLFFYDALKKAGHAVELHIVSRGSHGFFNSKGWGIPTKKELRFIRSGGQWPVWTLNWMLEEKLITNPSEWAWTKSSAALRSITDPQ